MKTLIVVGHPDLKQSRINKALVIEAQKYPEFTLNVLSEKYRTNILNINVPEEQKLLEEHDRIVLQFPFHWYSWPPILKAYIDLTLTDGFAYGVGGDKTKNKELLLAITTGGDEHAYSRSGYNYFSVKELLPPFVQTASLVGMNLFEPFLVQGANRITDEALQMKVKEYIDFLRNNDLKSLKRTDWK